MLGVLVAVVGGVLVWQFWPARAASSTSSPSTRPAVNAAARGQVPPSDPPPEVRLPALERAAPEPARSGRDPFRFRVAGPSPPVAPPPLVTGRPPQEAGTGPAAPAPLPPIPYKFIGMVTGEGAAGRIAVLSDGKFVYYGREGDIIEGRYRLVRIGEESLQIEYLDGRGRQTLRMSGS